MNLLRTLAILAVLAMLSHLGIFAPASADELEPSVDRNWADGRLGPTLTLSDPPVLVDVPLPPPPFPPPVYLVPPAPPPQPRKIERNKPVRPRNSPDTWVTEADYPAVERSNRSEGVTRFTLSVNAMGRVSGCQITKSSGFDALDQVACTTIVRRARFYPATDGRGESVEGSFSSAVRWTRPPPLAEIIPPVMPVHVSSYTPQVDANGKTIGCRVELAGGQGGVVLNIGGGEMCEQRFKPGMGDSRQKEAEEIPRK